MKFVVLYWVVFVAILGHTWTATVAFTISRTLNWLAHPKPSDEHTKIRV